MICVIRYQMSAIDGDPSGFDGRKPGASDKRNFRAFPDPRGAQLTCLRRDDQGTPVAPLLRHTPS